MIFFAFILVLAFATAMELAKHLDALARLVFSPAGGVIVLSVGCGIVFGWPIGLATGIGLAFLVAKSSAARWAVGVGWGALVGLFLYALIVVFGLPDWLAIPAALLAVFGVATAGQGTR